MPTIKLKLSDVLKRSASSLAGLGGLPTYFRGGAIEICIHGGDAIIINSDDSITTIGAVELDVDCDLVRPSPPNNKTGRTVADKYPGIKFSDHVGRRVNLSKAHHATIADYLAQTAKAK